MKGLFNTVVGILGSLVTVLFGGWGTGMSTLLIFMAVDYITGLMTAFIFHNRPKTQNGVLESNAGFKGLCRKFAINIKTNEISNFYFMLFLIYRDSILI